MYEPALDFLDLLNVASLENTYFAAVIPVGPAPMIAMDLTFEVTSGLLIAYQIPVEGFSF